MPLLTLDRLSHSYGHQPLLDDASLQIEAGERVCLIGRNGAGKSTLLRIVDGEVVPDVGEVWRQPGLVVARLAQDLAVDDDATVFDVVELNVSFYRPPNPEHVAQWLARVADRTEFRFAVKLHGDFTHQRAFETPRDLERGLDGFFGSLGPLAGSPRLATVLALLQ